MKRKQIIMTAALLLFVCVSLSGCIPGDGTNTAESAAGFFWGVWHGWIAPVSLIGSIFNRDLNIYEVCNKGLQYNIGFYMAVISGFGGLALTRGRKGKDHK